MEQGFGLFVGLFPSIGVIWVIGVRLHTSILIRKIFNLFIYDVNQESKTNSINLTEGYRIC